MILHLDLEPGELLDEAELQQFLSVGRTPLRECCIQLAEEKLLFVSPQKGTYVTKLNLKRINGRLFDR